jgi:hypothetical protein
MVKIYYNMPTADVTANRNLLIIPVGYGYLRRVMTNTLEDRVENVNEYLSSNVLLHHMN